MTCIVAFRDDDRVWMGSDSCAARDSLVFTDARPKVRSVRVWCEDTRSHEHVLWATAGLAAVGQVLDAAMAEWPSPHGGPAALSAFFRATLDAAGMVDKSGVPKTADCATMALVAWRSTLWEVGADFYVKAAERYAAIGSGEDVAYGALHACCGLLAERCGVVAVRAALDAASAHTAYVRAPFFITHTMERE